MAIELPVEAFLKKDLGIDEMSERMLSSSLPFSHVKCTFLGLEAGHVTFISFVALWRQH